MYLLYILNIVWKKNDVDSEVYLQSGAYISDLIPAVLILTRFEGRRQNDIYLCKLWRVFSKILSAPPP
jgi:hypothetical protein